MTYYQQAIEQGIRLYTAKEAAEYLGLAPRTVHLYAREGKLPGIRHSKQWFFTQAAMDKYLEETDKQPYTADEVFGKAGP